MNQLYPIIRRVRRPLVPPAAERPVSATAAADKAAVVSPAPGVLPPSAPVPLALALAPDGAQPVKGKGKSRG